MSGYRVPPTHIKTFDGGPKAKGGQGTVVVGTLILPEELATRLPEQALERFLSTNFAIKKLEWNCEDSEESVKFFKVLRGLQTLLGTILIARCQSFVHELSLMADLSHPNIVKLVGFVEDVEKGDAWIVLPWEANGNVREFLQSGEWDIPERISLVSPIQLSLVPAF